MLDQLKEDISSQLTEVKNEKLIDNLIPIYLSFVNFQIKWQNKINIYYFYLKVEYSFSIIKKREILLNIY